MADHLNHVTVRAVLLSLLALWLLSACVAPERYTSLDLSHLPCEFPGSDFAPVFFMPIEFREDGSFLYPEQRDQLLRFVQGENFDDLIFFIHGWNKNPSSAEADYQNFICRFHGKLDEGRSQSKREGKLKVVGIFWPSTITNRSSEPAVVKPASYYRIRNRVDDLAQTAFAPLLDEVGGAIEGRAARGERLPESSRLHLVGHSFGGRMIIRSFQTLNDQQRLVPLLQSFEATNVLLINAAAPPTFFNWINEAVLEAWLSKSPARFTPSTSSMLLNLYSEQDTANKYLFRLASAFNDDPQSCAVGACGIPETPTLCVDAAGRVRRPDGITATGDGPELNVRNVNTTTIVYGHSDIYKGRMAALVADLLYDEDTRELLELPAPVSPDCDTP